MLSAVRPELEVEILLMPSVSAGAQYREWTNNVDLAIGIPKLAYHADYYLEHRIEAGPQAYDLTKSQRRLEAVLEVGALHLHGSVINFLSSRGYLVPRVDLAQLIVERRRVNETDLAHRLC